MHKILLAGLITAAIAAPATASSPSAWAKFNAEVKKSCAATSTFNRPRTSAVIGFDDSLGKVAVLVKGIYPQPHMRGASGTMLCVYDKRTKKTWIDEAKGWTAPA